MPSGVILALSLGGYSRRIVPSLWSSRHLLEPRELMPYPTQRMLKRRRAPSRRRGNLLGYGEFRDDAGLDVDTFCERGERDAFVVAMHALQILRSQREGP
jgi:hypothetical protein